MDLAGLKGPDLGARGGGAEVCSSTLNGRALRSPPRKQEALARR